MYCRKFNTLVKVSTMLYTNRLFALYTNIFNVRCPVIVKTLLTNQLANLPLISKSKIHHIPVKIFGCCDAATLPYCHMTMSLFATFLQHGNMITQRCSCDNLFAMLLRQFNVSVTLQCLF